MVHREIDQRRILCCGRRLAQIECRIARHRQHRARARIHHCHRAARDTMAADRSQQRLFRGVLNVRVQRQANVRAKLGRFCNLFLIGIAGRIRDNASLAMRPRKVGFQ